MERSGIDIARDIARKEAINSAGTQATRQLADAIVTLIDGMFAAARLAALIESEQAAAHAAMSAKERALDEYGYGGDPTTARIAEATHERDEYKRRCEGATAREAAIGRELMAARASIAEIQKQRDVTQERLDRFLGACADQTIQIMELRGELMREREARARDIAELKPRNEMNGAELAAWQALAEQPARNVFFWSEPGESLNGAIKQRDASWLDLLSAASITIGELRNDAIAAKLENDRLRTQLADVKEQLIVADSDRVPLRMDLDIANDELRSVKAQLGRASLCIEQIRHGGHRPSQVVDAVEHALEAYEKASAEAANRDNDPLAELADMAEARAADDADPHDPLTRLL